MEHEITGEGWEGDEWVMTCSCRTRVSGEDGDHAFSNWIEHTAPVAAAI